MAPSILFLWLATNHFFLVHGSSWVEKTVYRPYGPWMCSQRCKESVHISSSIQDFHCRRIFTKNKESTDSRESFICLVNRAMSSNISTVHGLDSCLTHSEDDTVQDERTAVTTPNFKNVSDREFIITNPEAALIEASAWGNLCVVRYILSKGLADINCRQRGGRTLAMVAARNGQLAVFDFLVKRGCDLYTIDDIKNNLLNVACKGGNVAIVRKLLVNHTFNLETRGWHGWTPVMQAAYYGHRSVFDLVVSYGCNLKALDTKGSNILHLACIGGHIDMVDYILTKHTSLLNSRNVKRRTPVMLAVELGHKRIFDYLSQKGCNLNVTDPKGNNLLHLSCLADQIGMVDYILTKGMFDIDSRNSNGKTPLLLAADRGHVDVIKLLVSKHCDLKAVSSLGNNVLHFACSYGHVEVVKYLLTLGDVDVELENYRGCTPLKLAKLKKQSKVVALFKAPS